MNKEKLPNCLTVKPWNGLCICTVCVHVCPITIPHSSLSYTAVIHLRDGKDSQAGKLTMFFFPSRVVSITFHVLLSCHPISFFTKEGCTFVFLSRYKIMKSSCTDGFIKVTYGRKNLVSDWKEEAIRKRCIESYFFSPLCCHLWFLFYG